MGYGGVEILWSVKIRYLGGGLYVAGKVSMYQSILIFVPVCLYSFRLRFNLLPPPLTNTRCKVSTFLPSLLLHR